MAKGKFYADHLFMGGGQGASMHGDGKSGLLYPTSRPRNTAVEVFEARVPVLVLEKTFLTDSGGAGETRGGLGQRVRFASCSTTGCRPWRLFPEGARQWLPGLAGGHSGAPRLRGPAAPDGTLLHDCGAGELVTLERSDQNRRDRLRRWRRLWRSASPRGARCGLGLAHGRITETAARET